MIAPPTVIDAADFDACLPELPNSEGVFVIYAGAQPAYLAKTSMLHRRLQRVLRPDRARWPLQTLAWASGNRRRDARQDWL